MADVKGFYDCFLRYHLAILPMIFISYILGLLAIILIIKKKNYSDKIISSILAFLWLWVGIFFFFVFCFQFNPIMYLISGVGFIIQSILFLYIGAFLQRLSFKAQKDLYNYIGLLIILYALIIYPLIEILAGQTYPAAPIFGVDPCPVCIFTFGLLLLTNKKIPPWLIIIPFLWSLTGFFAVFMYKVYADIGEIIAGVLGTILIIYRNTKLE